MSGPQALRSLAISCSLFHAGSRATEKGNTIVPSEGGNLATDDLSRDSAVNDAVLSWRRPIGKFRTTRLLRVSFSGSDEANHGLLATRTLELAGVTLTDSTSQTINDLHCQLRQEICES